jgi:DNA polymerase (family X)
MPIDNNQIADLFDNYADLLDIGGANVFRVRAYHKAARTIRSLGEELGTKVARGDDLSQLPTIGEDLAEKIANIVRTGHFQSLDEEARTTPISLIDLLRVPGLGPRRVKQIRDALKVETLAQLEAAARTGKLKTLPGFSDRTEAGILEALSRHASAAQRMRLDLAENIGRKLLDHLKADKAVLEGEIAGSFRRRRDTVGDLDLVIASDAPERVMDRFTSYEDVEKVLLKGGTRASVTLKAGLDVDLRVVGAESYGAALHYFTGSRAHTIAMRTRARKKNLKINEYGVYDGETKIAGETENGVFKSVGLPFIPPELREERGEMEAAAAGLLPQLVKLEDIRGDLHVHTNASDGRDSLKEMALAARDRKYGYLAITDHSKSARTAHGMDEARLSRQLDEIDRLNDELEGITLLKSAEVEILKDGQLDLPDTLLQRLDLCVGAIHSHFALSSVDQTNRILRAMDNPFMSVLAHPACRLIGEREAITFSMDRVLFGAREHGCALEINGQPRRLDLDDVACRHAKELGIKLVLATDAHSAVQLENMRFAIDVARRGWLEADDILNTLPWPDLKQQLKRS